MRWFVPVALLVLVGVSGVMAFLASRAIPRDARDNVKEFRKAAWMPGKEAGLYERLMNQVIDKPMWNNNEDVSFLLTLMRLSPRELPPGFEDVHIPSPDDAPEVVASFLDRPRAMETLQWHFEYFARALAWAEIADRLVAKRDIPSDLRDEAIREWTAMLTDPDMYTRIEGSTSLVSTGLFLTDPNLEMRIEAMRRGDPSADVRAAIERRLAYYDRVHNGVEPSGPTSECNTCP